MIILGAGLTGCLAAYAFKNAVVHEYLETPNTHKALLRFRSEAVSELTGIPFKKVVVQKGIWTTGWTHPSISVCNEYSQKVTGGLFGRSISNIEPEVRFIAPVDFHNLMLDKLVSEGRVVFGSDVDADSLPTPIISTLPLNILLSKIGIDFHVPKIEKSSTIYVTTIKLENCDVYQTVYFPSMDVAYYRASITGNRLIIESISEIDVDDVEAILKVFKIKKPYSVLIYELNEEQKNGKFIPLNETERKKLMYDITSKHGIYSLGRHATWRKVLLDDIVHDIEAINRMITTSAYDLMIGVRK